MDSNHNSISRYSLYTALLWYGLGDDRMSKITQTINYDDEPRFKISIDTDYKDLAFGIGYYWNTENYFYAKFLFWELGIGKQL